jgi:signal transduction histidine kinase
VYWQFWMSFWENWATAALGDGNAMTKHVSSAAPKSIHDTELMRHVFKDPELKQRAREEFLASVNHDLRTPLNAVIGFAQIIETEMFGKVQPQYLEYARHIQESGYDLLSKIEDLVDPPSHTEPKVSAPKKQKKLALAE